MKITDWAIIFVIIVGPLLWISVWNTEQLREAHRLEARYTSALRTAAQDASSIMNRNELQKFETNYESDKFMRADKDAALESFIHTLAVNLGITDDPSAIQAMMIYIPAIVVIDYDGYYVYAMEEFIGDDGSDMAEHRWRPKKPYVYSDEQGNNVAFTLDQRITVIDPITGEVTTGPQQELAHVTTVPLLRSADVFEEVRRSVIVRSIEDDLAEVINKHNEITRKLGFKYTFTLPIIPQEDWNNTLNDLGVLSFLQGIPVGNQFYNNYALGGGRLVKTHPVYGGIDPVSGIKYASNRRCPFPLPAEEIFANAKDAAQAGYYEWSCSP